MTYESQAWYALHGLTSEDREVTVHMQYYDRAGYWRCRITRWVNIAHETWSIQHNSTDSLAHAIMGAVEEWKKEFSHKLGISWDSHVAQMKAKYGTRTKDRERDHQPAASEGHDGGMADGAGTPGVAGPNSDVWRQGGVC